jgi:hypothetical protein
VKIRKASDECADQVNVMQWMGDRLAAIGE